MPGRSCAHVRKEKPYLGNSEAAVALHQACQIVVHVVKHHVDTALEVVHAVHCRDSTMQTCQPAARAGPGCEAVQWRLSHCRGISQRPGQALSVT